MLMQSRISGARADDEGGPLGPRPTCSQVSAWERDKPWHGHGGGRLEARGRPSDDRQLGREPGGSGSMWFDDLDGAKLL